MDTAMRDLDQIRELDDAEGPGRRIAMVAMAALATVGLVFAMGVLLGRSTEDVVAEEPDALAALDEAMRVNAADAAEAELVAPTFDRQDLTFHTTLIHDERPEVTAAMAAVAAELAQLEPAAATPTYAATALPPSAAPAFERDEAPAGNVALAPTSAAASESRAPRAEVGTDGKYTLQVMSYRSAEEAEVFAEALRARGHAAFVQVADVPERGVYHRVRVGPFDSVAAAERYRRDFETSERMNTFVVRRRE